MNENHYYKWNFSLREEYQCQTSWCQSEWPDHGLHYQVRSAPVSMIELFWAPSGVCSSSCGWALLNVLGCLRVITDGIVIECFSPCHSQVSNQFIRHLAWHSEKHSITIISVVTLASANIQAPSKEPNHGGITEMQHLHRCLQSTH
jgi:hypothetical protein